MFRFTETHQLQKYIIKKLIKVNNKQNVLPFRYHNGYFRNQNPAETNNNNVNNNNRNVDEERVQEGEQPVAEAEGAPDAEATPRTERVIPEAAAPAAPNPGTSVMSIIKTFVITFITSLLPDTQTLQTN